MKKLIAYVERLNELIATRTVLFLGTMWSFYFFVLFTLIPMFAPKLSTTIMYISSSFLQLIFLPLIMVGQRVSSKKSEERAQQDHDVLIAQFGEIMQIHEEVKMIMEEICAHVKPDSPSE